jgi:hypothetical protein
MGTTPPHAATLAPSGVPARGDADDLLQGIVDVAFAHAQAAEKPPERLHVLAHHLPQACLDVTRAIRA